MSEQNTQEWLDERAGHVTASRICDVLTKPRKGHTESLVRSAYRAQLLKEIRAGRSFESDFQSFDMRRGKDLEAQARIEYELKSKESVHTVGFIKHPKIARAGCSPDALVGEKGMAQFKCPKANTHQTWLMAGIVPLEHRPQMYFEMAVTGREWSDFVSYDPDLVGFELFVRRLHRDEAEISLIEYEVEKFLAEIQATINILEGVKADERF